MKTVFIVRQFPIVNNFSRYQEWDPTPEIASESESGPASVPDSRRGYDGLFQENSPSSSEGTTGVAAPDEGRLYLGYDVTYTMVILRRL